MHKLIRGALIAVSAFAATAAVAADMSTPRAAVPMTAAAVIDNTWSGFYVGGHGGYGWGHADWMDIEPTDTLFGLHLANYQTRGWIGGGQFGWNYQTGNIVVGLEGDMSATGIDGNLTTAAFVPAILTVTSSVDWIAMATARLGYATNNWLFYLKGGGAWAHESHTITAFGAPVITDTETRPGWVIGAGAEWALARNWSLKAEYNYVDLGHSDLTFVEPPPFFNTSQSIEQKLHLVKFGINYRFQ